MPYPFHPPPNGVPSPTCGFFGSDFCLQFQGEPSDFLAWRGPGPPALALPRGVTLEVDEGDLAVRAGGTTWGRGLVNLSGTPWRQGMFLLPALSFPPQLGQISPDL